MSSSQRWILKLHKTSGRKAQKFIFVLLVLLPAGTKRRKFHKQEFLPENLAKYNSLNLFQAQNAEISWKDHDVLYSHIRSTNLPYSQLMCQVLC